MTITTNLPTIPATPGLPERVPAGLPAYLANARALGKLAREFVQTRELYDARAQAHREIANRGALNAAVEADDLAHAQALRKGDDDPGPVHVDAWSKAEAEARRAVAGARDALKLIWGDLLTLLADPKTGGALAAEAEQHHADARKRLEAVLTELRSVLTTLDDTHAHAKGARVAHEYAVARLHNNGMRPDGMSSRWMVGSDHGHPAPIVLNARPEPVENVLASIARYREE